MINLTSSGGTITFAFDNNSGYLQNGTIEVPVNSLSLVIDGSDMVTFKKANSNDVFVSALASDFGMTKAQLISFYKDNMVESISDKADYSAATISIHEETTTTGRSNYNSFTFDYGAGVYYLSAITENYERQDFEAFNITMEDASGNTVSINVTTSTGETDSYILEGGIVGYEYNRVLTTKGSYRITQATFFEDYNIKYEYKAKIDEETAASTAIKDEIRPALSSIKRTYVSGITQSISDNNGYLIYEVSKPSGTNNYYLKLFDDDTIKYNTKGLYVPITGETYDVILNTGNTVYYSFSNIDAEVLELTVNSGYTGSATGDSTIDINIKSGDTTYSNSLKYNTPNNTLTASATFSGGTFTYDPLTYKAVFSAATGCVIDYFAPYGWGTNAFKIAGVDMSDKGDYLGVLLTKKTNEYTPQTMFDKIINNLTSLEARVKALEDA